MTLPAEGPDGTPVLHRMPRGDEQRPVWEIPDEALLGIRRTRIGRRGHTLIVEADLLEGPDGQPADQLRAAETARLESMTLAELALMASVTKDHPALRDRLVARAQELLGADVWTALQSERRRLLAEADSVKRLRPVKPVRPLDAEPQYVARCQDGRELRLLTEERTRKYKRSSCVMRFEDGVSRHTGGGTRQVEGRASYGGESWGTGSYSDEQYSYEHWYGPDGDALTGEARPELVDLVEEGHRAAVAAWQADYAVLCPVSVGWCPDATEAFAARVAEVRARLEGARV